MKQLRNLSRNDILTKGKLLPNALPNFDDFAFSLQNKLKLKCSSLLFDFLTTIGDKYYSVDNHYQ